MTPTPTHPDSLDLDELERLESVASKAPWHREYLELSPGGVMTLGIGGADRPVCIVNGIVESPPGLRDVAFITALRNAAPFLIRSARLAREQAERIRELEVQVAELQEGASMACQEPAADCECAGCRYADEKMRTP